MLKGDLIDPFQGTLIMPYRSLKDLGVWGLRFPEWVPLSIIYTGSLTGSFVGSFKGSFNGFRVSGLLVPLVTRSHDPLIRVPVKVALKASKKGSFSGPILSLGGPKTRIRQQASLTLNPKPLNP